MQGLVLVSSSSQVKRKARKVEGLQLEDVRPPGGADALAEHLMPIFYHAPITESLIDELRHEISRYYRDHNYPIVRVIVPKQTYSNGVLQLIVIEGRLGKISVKGNRFSSAESTEKWVRLKSGETINELTLLRDIGWMNTNPFRQVSVVYRPGEQNGTTDIDLVVTDRRIWRVYAGGDNTGTPLIGRTRWFTGLNLANIFFPDHTFSFQFTTCNNFHEFKAYTFQYAAPLPWRNTLSFFGAYSSVHPNQTPISSNGKTYQLSGRYTVPQWFNRKTRVDEISYEVGFDFKGTNNNIIFGGDNANPIQTQLAWTSQFMGGFRTNLNRRSRKMAAGIELFWSPGQMFPHQTPDDYASLRAGATAHYFYTRLNYSFEQALPRDASFYFQGRLQFANSPLLASEQFALGGYSTVRGYDERVVNGDSAMCFNCEWRSPWFPVVNRWIPRMSKDALQVLGFLDIGYGWDLQQVAGFPIAQTLIGLGAGMRYRISPYFSMRCDLGFPLHSVVNDDGNPRVHLSAVLSY